MQCEQYENENRYFLYKAFNTNIKTFGSETIFKFLKKLSAISKDPHFRKTRV